MFIAFEGPDNVGKSTSARALTYNHEPIYNATKDNYLGAKRELAQEPDLVQCWDRIDWFSHMVYRLGLPEHEWNDDRPRTVFAMPDTHLVIKIHHPELALLISDELYTSGKVAEVNPMYYYFADFFMALNRTRDYSLFKTVSIVEVSNNPEEGTFTQRLTAFDSPTSGWDRDMRALSRTVNSDETLLAFLREEEARTL